MTSSSDSLGAYHRFLPFWCLDAKGERGLLGLLGICIWGDCISSICVFPLQFALLSLVELSIWFYVRGTWPPMCYIIRLCHPRVIYLYDEDYGEINLIICLQ